MSAPVYTTRMAMHMRLAGGSQYVHNVFRDGKPTNVVQRVTTRRGRTTEDVLICGDDIFDRRDAALDMQQWLEDHTAEPAEAEA